LRSVAAWSPSDVSIRAQASPAKHEINGTQQAQPGPQKVQFDRLLHVKDRERDEHAERDRFLQDLSCDKLNVA
jgi:hypothetical protein